jgi:hypothetical protein
MSRLTRFLVGLVVVLGLVLAAGWFDSTVMVEARRHAAATFSVWDVVLPRLAGFVLVGVAAGLIVATSWSFRSVALGVALILIGGLFTALETFVFGFGTSTNGAPPILPDWLLRPANQLYGAVNGPLTASTFLGAVTLVVGAALIGAEVRRRLPGRM